MSTFFIPKQLLLITSLIIFLGSCKKDHAADRIAALPTDEYIHYTVNGIPFGYDMPGDGVLADTVLESQSFIPKSVVLGQRIPFISSDLTRIEYSKANVAVGSLQTLISFATPQTEFYPFMATSSNPILVSITEYGNIGEYISGNFSALITGSAPVYLQYNVICNFRVKRRI